MEPEGLLPRSQELSTAPYPEPDQYNQYHSILSILILFIRLRISYPSGLFPSGSPTNILHSFLFPPFVLHALPISPSLTWSL
jgi:hypothetical protein